jgi:hypothetical protein
VIHNEFILQLSQCGRASTKSVSHRKHDNTQKHFVTFCVFRGYEDLEELGAVIVPGGGADEVIVDDARLVEVDAPGLGNVQRAFETSTRKVSVHARRGF